MCEDCVVYSPIISTSGYVTEYPGLVMLREDKQS